MFRGAPLGPLWSPRGPPTIRNYLFERATHAQDLKSTKYTTEKSPPHSQRHLVGSPSLRRFYCYSHVPDGKTEALTWEATCPRPTHHPIGLSSALEAAEPPPGSLQMLTEWWPSGDKSPVGSQHGH